MLCPFCKEEVAEGALKCKHCQSNLSPTPIDALISAPIVPSNSRAPLAPSKEQITIHIAALPVSEGLKQKLFLVHKRRMWKEFGSSPDLKLNRSENSKLHSLWAFLFNIIYYFVKGMWRKGLVLLVISMISQILIYMLPLPIQTLDIFSFLASLGIVPVIASLSAYDDLYRKQVLKQTFWW